MSQPHPNVANHQTTPPFFLETSKIVLKKKRFAYVHVVLAVLGIIVPSYVGVTTNKPLKNSILNNQDSMESSWQFLFFRGSCFFKD